MLDYKFRFNKLTVFLTCLINAAFGPILLILNFNSPMTQYFLCIIILLSEIAILFKGSPKAILGLVTGTLLHLFVLRGIIVSITSIVTQTSMYEIIFTSGIAPYVNVTSFGVQVFVLALFIKFIPLKTVKKIMEDKNFYTNLLVFTIFLTIYIVYNSNIFLIDYYSFNLAMQEIVITFIALSLFYIMLFWLIKIFDLEAYKDLTLELEKKINKDKSLTSAVYSFAEVILEANLTNDKLVRMLVNSKERTLPLSMSLSEFFKDIADTKTHPDDVAILRSITSSALLKDFEKGDTEKIIEFRGENVNNEENVENDTDKIYLWYRMRISTNLNKETSEVSAFFTIDDIEAEKQAALLMKRKAETDYLTGSFNRETFALQVDAYIKNGGCGALYMFDLDNFKGINDNMGHSAGDEVLRQTYHNTAAIFREDDYISRIGGDEFLVFLVGSVKDSTIIDKAEKICKELHKTHHAENGVDIEITCSVGISLAPYDATNFEDLFKLADIAMYHSKSVGKNTYTLYNAKEFKGFEPKEKEDYMRLRQDG